MNRNNTRFDDKFNGLLIATVVVSVIGMSVSTYDGAQLGRDGALARNIVDTSAAKTMVAQAAPVAHKAPVLVAAR